MEEEIMTLREAAKFLRISTRTLLRQAYDKEIPSAKKIGGQWRFSRAALEQYAGVPEDRATATE